MPTVFTHAIVPLAFAAAAGRGVISPKLAIAGAVLTVIPDADVIGFRFGIEYADGWGIAAQRIHWFSQLYLQGSFR